MLIATADPSIEIENWLVDDVTAIEQYLLVEKTTPEKELLKAILEDAYFCLCRPKKKREFRNAEIWIFEERNANDTFSFNNVCSVLNLSPDYLRKRFYEKRDKS